VGIGLLEQDWFPVVQKHRDKHKCTCQKSENKGKFCLMHGYQFTGPPPRFNITSTPEAEKLIQSRTSRKDERGKHMISTARGKRRNKNKK
jgi:hypothetical protein